MPAVPQTRRPCASPVPGWLCGLPVALALACGSGSLDEPLPPQGSSSTTAQGDTLPPVDTGDQSSTSSEDSSGDPPDDPQLCPPGCPITLPVDWAFEGMALPPDPREPLPPDPAAGFDPRGHLVPTMLRDPQDGSLVLAEQHDGAVSLHRLDRYGRLEWTQTPPLPCDPCDLTHVARHPSGDLLLSATGLLTDDTYGLLAARYDPMTRALVWVTTTPLPNDPLTPSRSGEIAGLSGGLVVQLVLEGRFDFDPVQLSRLVIYDDDGLALELDDLVLDPVMESRYPLLARVGPDDDLVIAVPFGTEANPLGLTGRIAPPLWNTAGLVVVLGALDDLIPDERGHTIELGHTFDGSQVRLVLTDRASYTPQPQWIATQAFDSTSGSRAALALGPQGDAYAALRTTLSIADEAEPLVALSMARFTTDGELRWRATLLERIAPSHNPVELAVDPSEGLIVAAVVDDRLRVERRTQHCGCE
ncbi:MAG: hypothetical protein KDK70_04185 [Myxococcales bacterium]|nr:hypothetical protein [Myxococcales bacterium]